MTETINNETTCGKDLVYTESFWFGKRSLSYDGTALKRKNNRQFTLISQSGDIEFTVEGNMFKGVNVSSSLFAKPVCVVKKLSVLEYVLAVLVFIPGFFSDLSAG